ncbi:MAG: two-component regulator propeller domain-containing protein [Chloracidobacterium sp.]
MWLAASVGVPGAVGGIPPAAVFERLTQEHGLSNNAVHCILQDRRGFLWIGTEDGLNRYDGFSFKVYRYQDNNPRSLPGNLIMTLYEDREGNLWVGTAKSGFCRYDPQTDSFVTDKQLIRDGQSTIGSRMAWRFYEDRAGTLWLCTDDGFFRFDHRRGDFTLHNVPHRDRLIASVYEDDLGQFWVASVSGLWLFDRTTGQFSQVITSPAVRRENQLLMISAHVLGQTKQGHLCVGFGRVGFFCLEPRSHRVVAGYDWQGNALSSVPTVVNDEDLYYIDPLWLDADDNLWGAQRPVGLIRLNLSSRQVQVIVPDPKLPGERPARRVLALFQDRSGVLWIGDGVAGVTKFSPTQNRFERYRHLGLDQTSLSDSYIRGIAESRSGRIWVCTQFGGFNALDRASGQVVRYPARPGARNALQSNMTFAVHEDRQGEVWIGTDLGLQRFRPQTGQFQSFPQLSGKARVHAIYEDTRRALWVSFGNGFYEISPDRMRCRDHTAGITPTGKPWDVDVQCIYEDRRDQHLWFGLAGRCVRYDPVRQTYREYVIEARPEYSAAYVTSFAEGSDGTLWMTTKGAGLCRFDPQRETFTHLLEQDGLPHNNCYAMFPDANGRFWLSSDAGIARFDPTTRAFRTYTTADGLQGREFNRFSAFQNSRGEIFFGGTQGLNIFDPAKLTDNPTPPPVALTELKINGQTRLAPEGSQLVVDYRERAVEVGFVALDFHAPADNRYRYWLEGFDRGWREAGARREASYTNLPPGAYRFWVMAANHDGVWSSGKVLFQLEIRPPWWQTWPAYVGFALTGGLLLYGGVRLRLRQLVARNRNLELKIAERTQEVTRKNEELAARNLEIESRNSEIAARNLEIEDQRRGLLESLTYARTIQQAMLPTVDALNAALRESFVLWKPKDIVSGDFYWFHQQRGRVVLVVADCTGHGVPGALMSMIGNDLLGQIVVEHEVYQPARILEALHNGVRRVLKQDGETPLPDGMDAAVCTFDQQERMATFAGARQSLYLVDDGVLTEIKGNRHAIGGSGRERRPRVFTNHTVMVSPGAMLYFTTDGFADQPSERGKKFGTRRLQALLAEVAGLSLAQQRVRLEAELLAHMGDEPQRDDITIVGVQWQPQTKANTNGYRA